MQTDIQRSEDKDGEQKTQHRALRDTTGETLQIPPDLTVHPENKQTSTTKSKTTEDGQ